jgi:hypothetical protein
VRCRTLTCGARQQQLFGDPGSVPLDAGARYCAPPVTESARNRSRRVQNWPPPTCDQRFCARSNAPARPCGLNNEIMLLDPQGTLAVILGWDVHRQRIFVVAALAAKLDPRSQTRRVICDVAAQVCWLAGQVAPVPVATWQSPYRHLLRTDTIPMDASVAVEAAKSVTWKRVRAIGDNGSGPTVDVICLADGRRISNIPGRTMQVCVVSVRALRCWHARVRA